MKKIIALLLAIFMVIGMVACAEKQTPAADAPAADTPTAEAPVNEVSTGEKVKITVLRPGDQEKVASFLEPAIEEFMKENPDIEVVPMYDSWAGWIQTYPTYFEANTQPDVIFWWDNKMFDASAKDHILNLEPYLSEGFKDRIPESVWGLVDSGLEGITYVPHAVDSFALYYNKDILSAAGVEVPTTWDELLEACKAITEKTGVPALGVPAITGSEVLEEFVGFFINQATGANILDVDSMPLFNTEEGLDAVKFVESLVPYFQPSCTEYGRGELRTACRDGNVAMIIDGPWAVATFATAYGEDVNASEHVGIAPVPQKDPATPVNWAGTNGWIATHEETAEASAKLIEYLMSPEVIKAHHLAYGSAPLYESEAEDAAFQYDHWKVFYNSTQNDKLFGMIGRNSATPSAYYTAIEEVWQQLVLGQISAEDAIAAAATAAENVTARNQ